MSPLDIFYLHIGIGLVIWSAWAIGYWMVDDFKLYLQVNVECVARITFLPEWLYLPANIIIFGLGWPILCIMGVVQLYKDIRDYNRKL